MELIGADEKEQTMQRKGYELPNGKKVIFEYDACGIGKMTLEGMDELMNMIAGILREWTPCSEKLPEREGHYLVTFGAYEKEIKGKKFIVGNINRSVSVVGFGCCQRDITGKPIGFGWYDLSSATYYDKQSVLAWMPLPEPYAEMNVTLLPSAQPTYTDAEIQKMQDLESAQIEKAYQLGYEEGKKDAQPEPYKGGKR